MAATAATVPSRVALPWHSESRTATRVDARWQGGLHACSQATHSGGRDCAHPPSVDLTQAYRGVVTFKTGDQGNGPRPSLKRFTACTR